MNLYMACAAFAAGIITFGVAAIWWDWKHPKPVRWDWKEK